MLGYSFGGSGPRRIGVWRGSEFHTYFEEEFPDRSLALLWNESGLIVITESDDGNSYLVPRPGVRLNLADLTEGPFPDQTSINDINDRGDMIGVGDGGAFLLRRVAPLDDQVDPTASIAALSPPTAAAAGARAHRTSALQRHLQAGLYDAPGRRVSFRSRDW